MYKCRLTVPAALAALSCPAAFAQEGCGAELGISAGYGDIELGETYIDGLAATPSVGCETGDGFAFNLSLASRMEGFSLPDEPGEEVFLTGSKAFGPLSVELGYGWYAERKGDILAGTALSLPFGTVGARAYLGSTDSATAYYATPSAELGPFTASAGYAHTEFLDDGPFVREPRDVAFGYASLPLGDSSLLEFNVYHRFDDGDTGIFARFVFKVG